MTNKFLEKNTLRIHFTNIHGLGATQVTLSLLYAFRNMQYLNISEVYIPENGPMSFSFCDKFFLEHTKVHIYKRYLPNIVSRFLECTLFSYKFRGRDPLLVVGDLPLYLGDPQFLFLQKANFIQPKIKIKNFLDLKDFVCKLIFLKNLSKVKGIFVQTEDMKKLVLALAPNFSDKIHVVYHPEPFWFNQKTIKLSSNNFKNKLRLFYPAALYPHKNHSLLSKIRSANSVKWPIESLKLTINKIYNTNNKIKWINCIGLLKPTEVLETYNNADALLFLSKMESYGLPLIEAMRRGMPILCSDLPYARCLCGNSAIYFNPDSVKSLKNSVIALQKKLQSGWLPDYTENLKIIDKTWHSSARKFTKIIFK